MSRAPKCIGLLGRIFGHKFIDLVGNRSTHCMRCGYKPTPWDRVDPDEVYRSDHGFQS